MPAAPTSPACQICRERVAFLQPKSDHPECLLANGSKVRVSRFLTAHISNGDEIVFPLFTSPINRGTELYVVKASGPGPGRDLYQAPVGYVTQPQKNKRDQLFVSAGVREGSLASPQSSCDVRFCATISTASREAALLRISTLSTTCCEFPPALLPLNFALRTN
jgi:hypothetical protein